MREQLAEQLLATVMGWEEDDVTRERPVLQAFADYKYDEYEQFQPGRRFIESLARWLSQFPEHHERQTAYRLFREKLIFVSRAEMQQLVSSVYPDVVRRRLLRRAAADLEKDEHLVAQISGSPAFKVRNRSCLFVGLSDGARTDVLRRANPGNINNEQVIADYHGLEEQKDGLLKDLRRDLRGLLPAAKVPQARFTTVVLLDDFSASGISYARQEGEEGKGKMARVARRLGALSDLVNRDDLEVIVVLYLATEQALEYLDTVLPALRAMAGGTWVVEPMQRLGRDLVIAPGDDPDLDLLIRNFYDPKINDDHMKKGGTDGRYGFADCGLSVILTHNTPNNSLALLWSPDDTSVRGLFPRTPRHRAEA